MQSGESIGGSPEFVEHVAETHVVANRSDRSVPAARKLPGRPSAEQIEVAVNEVLGETHPLRRKVGIYFCQRHGGMKLKQVGERFGIGDAAVSVTCKRLLGQAAKDRKVKESLEQIGRLLNVPSSDPCYS